MENEIVIHTDDTFLMNQLKLNEKKYDFPKIEQAYAYAKELHEGQFRASGEPYISHPIAVAEIVAGLGLDTDSVCAALLHDTVEDCSDKTNLDTIRKMFGPEVEMLVDGLTKIVNFQVEDKEEQHIENLRKMLLAMSRDVRVIFIKLCDRLHNMRTLSGKKSEEKRRLTALETMSVYAPLAHRLGMQKVKQELENLSLYYLDPVGYEDVKKHIDSKYGEGNQFIATVKSEISERMKEYDIECELKSRIKSVYSVYRKMYNQNKDFDQIYDFYALRIIVNTEAECYTVLGLIHEMYKSVPGRFKDYISTPKPNLYRSLHTTVIGREGIPFEVQIRTWEMHHIAEYGIAAHWKYKSGATSKEEMDKKLEWIANLLETEKDQTDPEEFMHAFKTDIFHDEVFAFTPKGDVLSLPSGSNVIDFAYAIHSKVGDRLVGAKINGNIVPIDHVLENGEIVEILTSGSSKGPSRDWLNIVKTSSARSKIRSWFKKEKKEENIIVGRSMFETELKRLWKGIPETDKNEILAIIVERSGTVGQEDFFNALGYGGLSMQKFLPKMREECEERKHKLANAGLDEASILDKQITKPKKLKSNGGVIVDGESGCEVKFARCCNPLPGDEVIGFVTRGYGISIHKTDCPNVKSGLHNPEYEGRWKPAHWDLPDNPQKRDIYEAVLRLYVDDRIGILADVTAVFADMRVSILQMNALPCKGDEGSQIIIKIGCRDMDHYNSIVSRLRSLAGVEKIVRGYTV